VYQYNPLIFIIFQGVVCLLCCIDMYDLLLYWWCLCARRKCRHLKESTENKVKWGLFVGKSHIKDVLDEQSLNIILDNAKEMW